MKASALARSAYSAAASIAPSGQDVEYRAFAEVTRRLRRFSENTATDFPQLAEAMHVNQRLWSILATDVANDKNPLPAELRAQVFYLFEFTRQHCAKVLRGDADVSVLVDINTAIMRGLRGTAPDEDINR